MSDNDNLSGQQRRGLLVIGVSICLVFGVLMLRYMKSPETRLPEKETSAASNTSYHPSANPLDSAARQTTTSYSDKQKRHSKTRGKRKSHPTSPPAEPPRDHLSDEIPAQPVSQQKADH